MARGQQGDVEHAAHQTARAGLRHRLQPKRRRSLSSSSPCRPSSGSKAIYGTVPIGTEPPRAGAHAAEARADALVESGDPAVPRRPPEPPRHGRAAGAEPLAGLQRPATAEQAECVMARVEYEEQGRAIEEEFYGVCNGFRRHRPLNWGFAPSLLLPRRARATRLRCARRSGRSPARCNPTRIGPSFTNKWLQQLMANVVARK